MKIFKNMKVRRVERFLDDVEYTFKCDNCGRDMEIPDFKMEDNCACGTKWSIKVITLATGKLKER
jgi:DNA-directed RNA polymerase subunit RPC12/RpoP